MKSIPHVLSEAKINIGYNFNSPIRIVTTKALFTKNPYLTIFIYHPQIPILMESESTKENSERIQFCRANGTSELVLSNPKEFLSGHDLKRFGSIPLEINEFLIEGN